MRETWNKYGGLLCVLRNGAEKTLEIDARRDAADEIEHLHGLLDEATTLLEVLVTSNPEKQIPYGDFAKKYRSILTPA